MVDKERLVPLEEERGRDPSIKGREDYYEPSEDKVPLKNYASPPVSTNKEIVPAEIVKTAYEVSKLRKKKHFVQIIREEKLPRLQIEKVGFGLFELFNSDFIDNSIMVKIDKVPQYGKGVIDYTGTVNDKRLGVTSPNECCKNEHCGMIGEHCEGHFGYIKLNIMIINPNYISQVVQILNIVCGNCAKLRIKREIIERSGILDLPRQNRLQVLMKMTKDVLNCSGESVLVKGDFACAETVTPYYEATKMNVPIGKIVIYDREKVKGKIIKIRRGTISPREIYMIFTMISNDTADLLGFDTARGGHPRGMIMEYLIVPPPNARTNNIINGRIKKDDYGEQYNSIIKINNKLETTLSDEKKKKEEETLITKVYGLLAKVDSSSNFVKSYAGSFGSKKGMIRETISTARSDQSGRTVTSQNPRLRYWQVGIPAKMAETLTFPEVVTPENKEELILLLRDGRVNAIEHGPNSKHRRSEGELKYVSDVMSKTYNPEPGDKLHRWLQNGDWVVIGRQPTLHAFGIMGMEVVIVEELTIQINVTSTTPFNADFDGDELNVHVPQTEEAMEQLRSVMSITNCVRGGHDNRLNVALTYMNPQNVASMTRNMPISLKEERPRDIYYPDEHHVREIFGVLNERIQPNNNENLPEKELLIQILKNFIPRLKAAYPFLNNLASQIKKLPVSVTKIGNPVQFVKTLEAKNRVEQLMVWYAKTGLLTGKMLFSLALPPNFPYRKNKKQNDGGPVIIKAGILVGGVVTKSEIGSSHGSISDRISWNYQPEVYDTFLSTIQLIADIWNRREGLSISYEDCKPQNPESEKMIANALRNVEVKLNELRYQKTGDPEKDAKIERKMIDVLTDMNTVAIAAAKQEPKSDPFVQLRESGAKGSITNFARIKLGGIPYFVNGGMIKPTVRGPQGSLRTSFYQFPGTFDLIDFGLNYNSLTRGHTEREMINNAEASRQGLLKGVSKTAESGEIYRKLRLYLQNLVVHQDGSVRDTVGNIIQSTYGYDAIDPKKIGVISDGNIRKQDFIDIDTLVATLNAEPD